MSIFGLALGPLGLPLDVLNELKQAAKNKQTSADAKGFLGLLENTPETTKQLENSTKPTVFVAKSEPSFKSNVSIIISPADTPDKVKAQGLVDKAEKLEKQMSGIDWQLTQEMQKEPQDKAKIQMLLSTRKDVQNQYDGCAKAIAKLPKEASGQIESAIGALNKNSIMLSDRGGAISKLSTGQAFGQSTGIMDAILSGQISQSNGDRVSSDLGELSAEFPDDPIIAEALNAQTAIKSSQYDINSTSNQKFKDDALAAFDKIENNFFSTKSSLDKLIGTDTDGSGVNLKNFTDERTEAKAALEKIKKDPKFAYLCEADPAFKAKVDALDGKVKTQDKMLELISNEDISNVYTGTSYGHGFLGLGGKAEHVITSLISDSERASWKTLQADYAKYNSALGVKETRNLSEPGA